jgi:capsular exopolysaccharide synthesis family protein
MNMQSIQSLLSRYRLLLKRWLWVIVLGIVIGGGATYIVTKLMQPVYQASTTIILSVTSSQSPYEDATASLEVLPTYAQLITAPKILQPVADRHDFTLKQLSNMISVKPQSNTQIIEVDVENSDPQLAAELANEVAQSFAQFSSIQLGNAAQIQLLPAIVPPDPVHPRPSLDALLGALAGLGLALALIVVFEWTGDRLISPEEIDGLLKTDTLTIIPEIPRKQWEQQQKEQGALAEGCRMLSTAIVTAQQVQPFKTLLITSTLADEGKTAIAARTASLLALSGKRVLLVDANLRNPALDEHFQLNNRKGLSNVFFESEAPSVGTRFIASDRTKSSVSNASEDLDHQASQKKPGQIDLKTQATKIPSLRVLTSGLLPANPAEVLQSYLTRQLFSYLKNSSQFDYIIFDAPPVLPIADAQILASHIETTILVVDMAKTSRKALVRAHHLLQRTGTRILGIALNKSQWSELGNVRAYLNNVQPVPRKNIVISPPTELFDRSPEAPELPPSQPVKNR